MGGESSPMEDQNQTILTLYFIRKENCDIGERTFEDYDVELINPPMLRLREDLSV